MTTLHKSAKARKAGIKQSDVYDQFSGEVQTSGKPILYTFKLMIAKEKEIAC